MICLSHNFFDKPEYPFRTKELIETRQIFDSFLIGIGKNNGKNVVVYKVHWEKVNRREKAGGKVVSAYENISGGVANDLPSWAKPKSGKLISAYSSAAGKDGLLGNEDDKLENPIELDNPIE